MKIVLLTGATGFLGSHLLEGLVKQNYKIIILKRSTSDTWRINHLVDSVVSYDVDKVPVESAFEKQRIDAVFHTACNYGRNQSSICELVEDNLVFGLRVMEAAIKYKVDSFFNTDTLLPDYINNYSVTKHHFTDWLKKSSDKIRCVNLRIEHIYGPKDDKTKFVPWLLDKMINSHEIIKLTQGIQKRDFIYVDDVVSAYMLLLEKTDLLQKWNEFDVGTNSFISVKDFINSLSHIVQILKGISVEGRIEFGAVPYRKGEIMEPVLDNTKLLLVGWKPETDIEAGLRNIVKKF